MGNFCCADDISKVLYSEEYYYDPDKNALSPGITPLHFHSRLETVKEDAHENSELSENRSLSRASRNNY